ncbi:MAG: hypothetical protein OEW42_05295, partial [Acidimicrobiia bacterium]|nr:hypothetical protein [Acidimicrobiia bacterium]
MTTVTEPSPPLEDDEPPSSAERRRRRIRIGLIAAALVTPLVAWLAFGYFGVQYLFIDDEVDEANPFAAAVESDADPGSPVATPAPGPTAAAPAPSVGAEPPSAPTAPAVSTAAQGRFESGAHPTEGEATVITDGSARFLRFE